MFTKEGGGDAVQLNELRDDQPPPYPETSVLIPIEREDAVQSFLVPPPPPPSPGDALRAGKVLLQDVPPYQAVPLPTCPPMTAVPSDSLIRPSPALQYVQQPVQNLPQAQTLSYTNPLRFSSVLSSTPTMVASGEQYAPPPPRQPVGPGVIPVAPPPPPIVGQHSTQNITNQNVNTNTNQNVVSTGWEISLENHYYAMYTHKVNIHSLCYYRANISIMCKQIT